MAEVRELEAALIHHLQEMNDSRNTDWNALVSLCLAAYDLGTAFSWDKALAGGDILAGLQGVTALIECSMMSAPLEILEGQHPAELLCRVRSGLEF